MGELCFFTVDLDCADFHLGRVELYDPDSLPEGAYRKFTRAVYPLLLKVHGKLDSDVIGVEAPVGLEVLLRLGEVEGPVMHVSTALLVASKAFLPPVSNTVRRADRA